MPPKRKKPSQMPIPDDDPRRVAQRRLANREAAKRCRQRSKDNYNKLRQDYLSVDCANVAKQDEIRQLQKLKEQLEAILREHQCVLQNVGSSEGTCQHPISPDTSSRAQPPAAALGAPLPSPPGQPATTPGPTPAAPLPGPLSGPLPGPSEPDAAPTLPADIQSQLLTRFLPGGDDEEFGLEGGTGDEGEADSDTDSPFLPQQTDTEEDELLDERFETTIDLGSHIEHSYCHGRAGSQQPDAV